MKVFSSQRCILGEGPLWHQQRGSFFWVDIHGQHVFEKHITSANVEYDNCWSIPCKPSALACVSNQPDKIWVVCSQGLALLDTITGCFTLEVAMELAEGMRTNDAGIGPDAKLWIGTMEDTPSGPNGALYSIATDGYVEQVKTSIAIPNTFCWSPQGDRFYLTDSMQQLMQRISFDKGRLGSETVHVDLRDTAATPDGGAIDTDGNLWNAQWDGARIAVYEPCGTLRQTIELPVARPTSCCFGGENMDLLLITSASEGLSATELEQTPLSGCTLIVETTPSQGLILPRFALSSTHN